MAQIFFYKAADRSGTILTGTRPGESKEEVIRKLQEEGLFPLQVKARKKREWGLTWKIKSGELMAFTRQLASLLSSGLKIDQAISLVAALCGRKRLAAVALDLNRMVREGAAFSQALARYEKLFGRVYLTLVEAGERAGLLPEVLNRLATTLEEQDELRKELTNSLLYPVFVTIISGIATFVLIQVVVPSFAQLFVRSGQELPVLTRMVMAFSQRLPYYVLGFILVLLGLAFCFTYEGWSKATKLALARFQLAIPVFGPLRLRLGLARFARMLSLMLQNGVQLVDGISILKNAVDNRFLTQLMEEAELEVRKGGSLARCFSRNEMVPDLVKQMVAIGEEVGNLDEMLGHLARFYEQETRSELKNIMALLGPVLILFLTGVVFLIVAAILLPIINAPFFG